MGHRSVHHRHPEEAFESRSRSATRGEWLVIIGSSVAVAALAIAICLMAGCHGVSLYAETNGQTTEGPKGGNVREQDGDGYALGVILDLGEIFLPPRPQPVYVVQAPPGSWEAAKPELLKDLVMMTPGPTAMAMLGTGAGEIQVPAWVDPHATAHDFPERSEPRCRNCGRTRGQAAAARDGS